MALTTGRHDPYKLADFEINLTVDDKLTVVLKSTPDSSEGDQPGLESHWVLDRAIAAGVADRLRTVLASSDREEHYDEHIDGPSFAVQRLPD